MPTEQAISRTGTDGRFKPGESGNPNGRPLGRVSFEELCNRELDKPVHKGSEITKRQSIAMGFIDSMEAGTLSSEGTKLFGEYIKRSWPVITKTELTGADGAPLNFRSLAERANGENQDAREESD
jgi:hypothetical protein